MIAYSLIMYPDTVTVHRLAPDVSGQGVPNPGAPTSSADLPASVQFKVSTSDGAYREERNAADAGLVAVRQQVDVGFPADPLVSDGDSIAWGSLTLNVLGRALRRGSGGTNWRVRCEYVQG